MRQRIVPLQGVSNFRDFGDYPTRDGRHLVRGRLFRSAALSAPTPSDIEILNGLDVRLVADLRRDAERAREPSVWPVAGAARVVHGAPELQRTEPPTFITFLNRPDVTPEASRAFTIKAFRDVVFDPLYLRLFGDALRAIAESEAAVVVHCSQGKDRTGLLCALALHMLGVPEATILEDFELTNLAIDLENRLPEAQESFSRRYGVNVTLEVLAPMLGVHADYLLSSFQGMRDAFGSIEDYLDEIGVDAATRERMRARYIL